jgi:hypothetical protein
MADSSADSAKRGLCLSGHGAGGYWSFRFQNDRNQTRFRTLQRPTLPEASPQRGYLLPALRVGDMRCWNERLRSWGNPDALRAGGPPAARTSENASVGGIARNLRRRGRHGVQETPQCGHRNPRPRAGDFREGVPREEGVARRVCRDSARHTVPWWQCASS